MKKLIDIPDDKVQALKIIAIKEKSKNFKEWIEKVILDRLYENTKMTSSRPDAGGFRVSYHVNCEDCEETFWTYDAFETICDNCK